MKVLAGGPARETTSELYQRHKESLRSQTGFRMYVAHEVVPDPGGDRWPHHKIEKVARSRQTFMVSGMQDDGLFMVDTDVVLGQGVLQRMWEVAAPVVYGVFWTRCDWGGFVADWPQVWDIHPYGWTSDCWQALRAPGVNEVEVLGGGACTLIRGRGFESRYWPLLRSFERHSSMMAGEDRTYALGLECRGIRQVAVTGLPIEHNYA